MEVRLGSVQLGEARNNAAVFFGENRLAGWRTRYKMNSALSRVSGDGNYIGSLGNCLCDPDVIDVLVTEAGETK